MPTGVYNVDSEGLIRLASFNPATRPQFETVTFFAASNENSSFERLVPYGLIIVGFETTGLGRLFPFVGFARQLIYQGGAAGAFNNPLGFVGYYSLLFQPFANATGQEWTLQIAPD